ncbi:hypothetical protein DFQ27_004231 [Actinomortierella ambigua]|uniref:Uncharacterized protein n=1 Tax=Actinomortierella ambigua TaxID=1343610 RepID=A0A9P6Q3K7_9FUNG|nr:hypothetical protein DFQ26_003896 [Actinomortierella ambigua]KAG0259128.1 hypothetical protein DFQ27_004231 [Actinomortierella ambigua]
MHKLLALFVTLCFACVALARYDVDVFNNDLSKKFRFTVTYDAGRACWCVKNTQTGTIQGVNGGTIRLFSTTDCTGKYNTIPSNGRLSGTQWVNSFSMGASGASSDSPNGYCPNWYTIG